MIKQIRQLAFIACMLPKMVYGNVDPIQAQSASFKAATSQLDQEGSCYCYLNVSSWMQGLSEKVSELTHACRADIEDTQEAEREEQKIALLTYFIQISGLENLDAVGMSSVLLSPGLHRNKFVMTHGAEKDLGYFWKAFGGKPHRLEGLSYLPRQTAVAIFGDLDFKVLWAMLEDVAAHADLNLEKGMHEAKSAIATITGMQMEQILDSMGGHFGFIGMPIEEDVAAQEIEKQKDVVRAPALIMIKVNNDLIFNWIDRSLSQDKNIIRIDNDKVKIRKMPAREGTSTLVFGYNGEYLLFATSESLLEEVLAVKEGKKEGLQATESFKTLSKDMPKEGLAFSYVNKKQGDPLKNFRGWPDHFVTQLPRNYVKYMAETYESFLNHVVESYTVSSTGSEGIVSTTQWKTKEFVEK